MFAHSPRHILLIRPSALGDVCRTVPVLVSLKRAFPQARVDWLVQDSFIEAIASHPDLGAAIPFPRKALGRSLRRGRVDRALSWMQSLRKNRYDLVIDAQGLFRSGLIARATGARVRVGYRNAQEHAGVFYTHRADLPRAMHTVDRMLGLVESIGVEPVRDMRLFASEPDRKRAAALCPAGAVVLAPTSRWAAKRWPIDRFAELTGRLLDAGHAPIAIVGGPGEESQCAALLSKFRDETRVVDLVGQTGIGVLMAVIERARVVVANDSAALHMAVGFDRPTVALFGPTDVARVGPYQRQADVIQHIEPGESLNHKDDAQVGLMERIGVEEVARMTMERLAGSS